MEALIPFDPPEADLTVEVVKVLEAIDPEPVSGISEGSFNSPLLIGPVGVTQMNRKTVMTGEVEQLGVKLQFRTSLDDDGLEVVIPVSTGHASHLPIGFDMAFQEKLQILPGIKPDVEVSGVGQDHGKSIRHSPGEPLLDPIDLNFLPGKKRQFMVSLPALVRCFWV